MRAFSAFMLTAAALVSPAWAATRMLEVDSRLVECSGVARTQCLRVRGVGESDWRTFHGQIENFTFEPGYRYRLEVEEFPVEKWDAILAINLTAAFHAMRLVIPAMRAQGWGRIVNIASAHGLVASPFKSAYVAAKHGLIGLTKVAALELAESGITCNAICPGYVWTPLVERQIEEQAAAHGIAREQVVKEVLLASQPSKRFAAVEELGALTLFLCTGAAASITGTALPVDGGWTAH